MQQLVCGETMEPDLIQVFQYEKHQDKKKKNFPDLMERNKAEGTQKFFPSVQLSYTPQEIFNLLSRKILFRKLEKV